MSTLYTRQNTRVMRWQSEMVYVSGAISAVPTHSFMVSLVVNNADATDTIAKPWDDVSFDLLDGTLTGSITAAGKTVSYAQLGALMNRAALDRANAQGVI